MHLDLERKANGAGGYEGENQPDERTHRNRRSNNYNNNNNSNSDINDSHSNNRNMSNNNNINNNNISQSNNNNRYRDGESGRREQDRGDEGDDEREDHHPNIRDREIGWTTRDMEMREPREQANGERRGEIGWTTRDMETREPRDGDNTRIIEPPESTATIMEKSITADNGDVVKPMIEKPGISNVRLEGKKMYQYLSTLIAGHMAMQSGMTLGWTSPTSPFLKSKESFLPNGLPESEESWVCSLLALGAVLGAVPAGKIADRIGRKAAIIATALPFTISWLMIIFSRDLISLYVARFIGGIGAGSACVLVPVYIGEVAEASIRGALGSFFPLLFSLGIVFVYVTGAYASYTTFNVACCLALLPFFATVYFLPESPMWLVHKNRMRHAAKSLEVLRGGDYDAKHEISLLQIEADRLENRRGGLRDLVGTRQGRKALVTCVGLMWFQQMSGIDAVLFYTVTIFQGAGGTIEPYVATIIIGIVEVVMSIVVATVIDKFGRKPLLIMSGTAMTLCLGVLGYYFKLKDAGQDITSIGWLPLTCLALFNVVFSLGYGSVPFAVISELFPPETKGVASSISIMTNWILVFAVTKIFPTMVAYMGQAATFWTFSFMCAMSAVFAYFLVPETKGKTLQEIQAKLEFRKDKVKIALSMEPA